MPPPNDGSQPGRDRTTAWPNKHYLPYQSRRGTYGGLASHYPPYSDSRTTECIEAPPTFDLYALLKTAVDSTEHAWPAHKEDDTITEITAAPASDKLTGAATCVADDERPLLPLHPRNTDTPSLTSAADPDRRAFALLEDSARSTSPSSTAHGPDKPMHPEHSDNGVEKRRSKDRSKALKRAKRERDMQSKVSTARQVKAAAAKYRRRGVPIHTALHVPGEPPVGPKDAAAGRGGLPVTPNAFTGRLYSQTVNDCTPLDKDTAVEKFDLRYIEWNGRCMSIDTSMLGELSFTRPGHYSSDVMPILDKNGIVFAVCVGRPKDEGWDGVMADAQAALDKARQELKVKGEGPVHGRGQFSVIASGISFGGGQTKPTNVSYSSSKTKEKVVSDLLGNTAIQRITGFGDSAFSIYAPRLHEHYSTVLTALLECDPGLRRNFKNSAFASITFNLGPRTATYIHADHQNLPAGWCAITALGDYDPTAGGHIILWDAQLIIEFPPGATILIPSALVKHSNTTIQPYESRYSLTQYSAGGLFRWIESGFQSQKDFQAAGGKYARTGRERWLDGIDMFSTWAELHGESPSPVHS